MTGKHNPIPSAVAALNRFPFNTTDSSPLQLDLFEETAPAQNASVLAYFAAHPDTAYTPEEIHHAVMPNAPLISAQRAVSTLANSGLLKETKVRAGGRYGRLICRWRLSNDVAPV